MHIVTLYTNNAPCSQVSQPSPTMPLKQFRFQLADLLIGDYCSRKRPEWLYTVTKQLTSTTLPHANDKVRWSGRYESKRNKCIWRKTKECWMCKDCNMPLGLNLMAILMTASPDGTNRICVKKKMHTNSINYCTCPACNSKGPKHAC